MKELQAIANDITTDLSQTELREVVLKLKELAKIIQGQICVKCPQPNGLRGGRSSSAYRHRFFRN